MIAAEFFLTDSVISGFKIGGHADYDEYGKDIACASVSSTVQHTANLITEVFGFDAAVSAENDTITLKTGAFGDSIIQKLFAGLVLQMKLLSQEFEGTIRIKFTEV